MRQVKFKKYNETKYLPELGVPLLPGQSRVVVESSGFDKDFIHNGVFHMWGVCYLELGEGGVGNYTVAIVEDREGKVHEVLPSNLVFSHETMNKL